MFVSFYYCLLIDDDQQCICPFNPIVSGYKVDSECFDDKSYPELAHIEVMSRVASTVTFFLLVTVTSRAAIADTNFLRVEGSKLVLGDEEVYLSGANLPWVNYGNDFGNAQPNGVACALQADRLGHGSQ